MAIICDSFLSDLNDLSDNDKQIIDMSDICNMNNNNNLNSLSNLQKSSRYINTMQRIEDAFRNSEHEDDAEYQLIVDCNELSLDIEDEIVLVYNFIRDHYRSKFPELESLVPHPIDYARVVYKIKNELDLTLVDLQGLLPSATIMAVCIAASMSKGGKPLEDEEVEKVMEGCERVLSLDLAKKKVVEFIESRMECVAPNLSCIVGKGVAAKLVVAAGGLGKLGEKVQVLGSKRKILAGFSTATAELRVGFLEETEIYQNTPPSLRKQACGLMADKSRLAARVDYERTDLAGKYGRVLRDEICRKIEKLQEAPPAKMPKPLPIPDSEPKKKRGGLRLRKRKERYAPTEMMKQTNRMEFGVPEESTLGDGIGEGLGMLGRGGKLRVPVGPSGLAAKAAKKRKDNYPRSSSSATLGLTSSLAFTPVQGIELANPLAHTNQIGCGLQSTYFSETGTFSKVRGI